MNWKQLLLLLILSAGGLFFLSLRDTDRGLSEFVPEPLHDIWLTRDPSYSGRFVELHSKLIVFGIGDEGLRREHRVLWIEPTPLSDETLFTVAYLEDDGTESRVELTYSPKNDDLRFTSRPYVHWQREATLLAEDTKARRRAEESTRAEPTDPFGDEFDRLFSGPIWAGDETPEIER